MEVLEPYVHYAAAINIELVASDLSCTMLRFSVFTGPLGSDPKACVRVAQYDINATQLLVQPVGTSVDLLTDSNPGVLRVFLPRRRHLPLHTLWSMARTVQSYRFVDKEKKLLNVREECVAVHLAYLVPLQFLQLRKQEIEERLDRLMARYWRWNEQCKWFSLAKQWPKWVLAQKNRLKALVKVMNGVRVCALGSCLVA